ncbi:hypothetical protein CUMW_136480 [Citrus unshiu]|nr:hypothetical protein CUMW_136480 [Citrus unshiu]
MAVKNPKMVDESKAEVFINEVVILSQINQRNITRLRLGDPNSSFSFISNGMLFKYIIIIIKLRNFQSHGKCGGALLLKFQSLCSICIQLLPYLFIIEISRHHDQQQLIKHTTTQVHGTFGYLDHKYFGLSQFNEKSVVYSFGVILAELKTNSRQKLAAYYLCAVKEDHLFEILGGHFLKKGSQNEIVTIAKLAKRCLNLNGKKATHNERSGLGYLGRGPDEVHPHEAYTNQLYKLVGRPSEVLYKSVICWDLAMVPAIPQLHLTIESSYLAIGYLTIAGSNG